MKRGQAGVWSLIDETECDTDTYDCYGMKEGKFPLAPMFVFLVVAQTLCFIQFSL